MNKKIKQLWDNSIEEFSKQHQYATIMLPEPLREKFAELIVRECIGIADELVNRNVDGSWTSNELYTDYNGALHEVKRRIEQHFGVEE